LRFLFSRSNLIWCAHVLAYWLLRGFDQPCSLLKLTGVGQERGGNSVVSGNVRHSKALPRFIAELAHAFHALSSDLERASALSMVIEVSMVIEGEEPLAFPHLKARVVVTLGKNALRLGDGLVVVGALDHLDLAKAALSIH
jgi:hypothetical protein